MIEKHSGTFNSDGHELAYTVSGEGEPILLIHGFASTAQINWFGPSWVNTLARAGRQVVTIDNRGHGASAKLYDPADYEMSLMAEDARRLLDHLGIDSCDVMGYSMGARITLVLAMNHPDRVRRAVIGGLGENAVHGFSIASEVVAALEAPSIDDVEGKTGRIFRQFAEQTRSDLRALAACMRESRGPMDAERLSRLTLPVLICVGGDDDVAGDPHALGDLIPGAEVVVIPRRDHMRAVGDRVYKDAVLDFLGLKRS
ncbi:MAG: alpha/beta fold hydrolase [Flavobacteriaceae bacterium]